MENRFKFRAFNSKTKEMCYFNFDKLNDESRAFYENEIKDCIVMQSTGLTDTDGKEIFENDILKIKDNIYKIIWDEDCLQYFLEKDGFKFCWSDCFDEEKRKFIVEIIGNSFDNKELLGE